VPPRPDRL